MTTIFRCIVRSFRRKIYILLVICCLFLFVYFYLMTKELDSVDNIVEYVISQEETKPSIQPHFLYTAVQEQVQDEGPLECSSGNFPQWAKVSYLEIKGHYQKVQDRNIFVYSAYFDNRIKGHHIIQIMGISMEEKEAVYCQIVYKSGRWISLKANVTMFSLMLPELHVGFKYRPYFITCLEATKDIPVFVGISTRSCQTPTNVLQIQWDEEQFNKKSELKPKIVVCMKTIFDSIIPQRLIEFIEWQKMLNVDQIILYDTDNITSDMNRTIFHYVSEGILKIKSYIPPVSHSDLRDRGQLVQINDCLYRNMYKYQYLTFLDPDEMIIPRLHDVHSYSNLINTLLLLNSSAAGYRFPNVIFCLKPSEENQVPPDLLSIRKLVRTDIFPYGTWTKVIVNPRRIVELGIHRIEKAVNEFIFPVFVPPPIAALHHYRRYDFRYCAFKDRTTLRYEREIMKRYKEKIMLLKLK